MKIRVLTAAVLFVAAGLGLPGCASGPPSVDPGDGSVGNLIWGVVHYGFEASDRQKGIAYADLLLEKYGDEARAQQASLDGFPPTGSAEAIYKYRTLNLVATGTLLKGVLLVNEGDVEAARGAFQMVVDDFGYAQNRFEPHQLAGFDFEIATDENEYFEMAEVAESYLVQIRDR